MPDPARLAWAAAGAAATLAIVAGVAFASRTAIGEPATGSELRLALRAAHARLEICRERSDEELAKLPAHFRVRKECEETAIDYRLTLDVDGERRIDQVISHRGVRRTRPLAIDESISLPTGVHQIAVAFVPEPPASLADSTKAEEVSPSFRTQFAALPASRFSERVQLVAGRAELLVLDENGQIRRGGLPLSRAPAETSPSE